MNKPNDPRRVLVIQTAFLGDIVLTIPLLSALKRHRPGASVYLLTTPVGKALLDGRGMADGIIAYDKKGSEKGAAALLRKITEIRAFNIDTVISPHRSLKSGIIALLSGARTRIGYALPHLFPFYNLRVRRHAAVHEIDRILALLGPLDMALTPVERYPLLNARNGKRDPKLIGIAPGSVWGTKRWTEQGYAELIKKLHGDGFDVVLIGSKPDADAAGRIESMAGAGVRNTAGVTDMPGLIDLLSGIGLLVTNDNGAMQVAQALNTPIVAIFGPTVPEQGFAPVRPNTVVVENKGLACRPCSAHGPASCPEGHFLCMEAVTPDTVYKAVKEMLG